MHIADQVLGAVVGDDVTVARYGLVHACTLGDGVVVGESSVVMDGASVGAHALIAADSVVPPRKNLPGGFVYAGHPAKPLREIGRDELAGPRTALRGGHAPAELASAQLPAWPTVVRALPQHSRWPLHALHGRVTAASRARTSRRRRSSPAT